MSASPLLIPQAQADVAESYHWYEEKASGLGMEFIRCVEATLLGIGRSPRLYPTVHLAYRRALVRRFPFAVFFEIDAELDCCVVYAVFHCSQEPGKWMPRLKKQSVHKTALDKPTR